MSLLILLRAAALHFLVATAASAHLLLPFSRERNTARATDGTAELPLAASGHVFVVNATVGTPGQPVSLLLSPSSPHTWVPKSDVMPCMTRFDSLIGFYSSDSLDGLNSACAWGTFSSAKSSTYKTAEQLYLNFVVAYTDTINVEGVNVTDTLALGDIKIEDFSMGVVSSTSNQQWVGMLGLGNDGMTNFPRYSPKYRPNFVDRLVLSGKINSPAYSIWLNDPEGASGNLLLGAVDQSRYEGDLVRLNAAAQPYEVFPSAFRVSLAAVNVNDDKSPEKITKLADSSIVVSLSPSETFSYLPDKIVEGIITAAGATWNDSIKRVTVPCNAGAKSTTNFHFQLEGADGPVLNARLSDLIVPQVISRWEIAFKYLADLAPNTCLLGVQKYTAAPSTNGPQYNLGSSILRRTYMVFDAANKDVGIAPVKSSKLAAPPSFSTGKLGIVPFEKFGARIPTAKLYCTGSSCDSAPSSGTQSTSSGSGSGSGSSTDGDGTASGGTGSSSKMPIIIGVVVPIVLLALIVPAVLYYLRRRKRQQQTRSVSVQEKVTTTTTSEESLEGSDYGFTVTVSGGVANKDKEATTPEFFLGVPGALPIIPEERFSQCWDLEGTKVKKALGSVRSGSETRGGSGSSSEKSERRRSRQ